MEAFLKKPVAPPKEESYFETMMNPRQINFDQLYQHQIEALDAILNKDNSIVNPKILSLPTGAGKSAILVSIPFVLKKKRVLVVAPNLEIFKQLKELLMGTRTNPNAMTLIQLNMLLPQARFPSVEAVDSTKKLDVASLRGRDIVLANADKFHTGPSSAWQDLLPKDFFDLVIVDEAHHLPSQRWKTIVEFFHPCDLVFLTATPYRANGSAITAELKEPLCNGRLVYHLTLDRAIRDGLIKEPIFNELPRAANDPDDRVLKEVANKLRQLNANLQPEKHYQGMVLALDADHAEVVKQRWKKLKLDDIVIDTYHTGRKKQKGLIMSRFKRREIKVLIVVNMLREGFDHPPISVVGVVRNVQSPLVFVQFIGRAFRVIRNTTGNANEEYQQKAFVFAPEEYGQRRNWDKFVSEKLIDAPEE